MKKHILIIIILAMFTYSQEASYNTDEYVDQIMTNGSDTIVFKMNFRDYHNVGSISFNDTIPNGYGVTCLWSCVCELPSGVWQLTSCFNEYSQEKILYEGTKSLVYVNYGMIEEYGANPFYFKLKFICNDTLTYTSNLMRYKFGFLTSASQLLKSRPQKIYLKNKKLVFPTNSSREIKVSKLNGQKIIDVKTNEKILDLSSLTTGIYILTIKSKKRSQSFNLSIY